MGWSSKIENAARHLQTNPHSDNAGAPGKSQVVAIEDKNGDAATSTATIAAASESLTSPHETHTLYSNPPEEKDDAIDYKEMAADIEAMKEASQNLAEDSPYPEVRAAVRTTDGGEVANTVRAWILGFIFVTIGGGLNMFLSMRWEKSYYTDEVFQC